MTQDQVEVLYERWVSYPNVVRYVPSTDHGVYATYGGFWCTDWLGDYAMVERLGVKPEDPLPRKSA